MASGLTVVLEIATCSDPGRVRPHNEDSVFADGALGLALLADGMGGYSAGEVASGMATTLLAAGLAGALVERDTGDADWARGALAREIGRANAAIHETAANQPRYSGMGTTLVAALFHDDRVAAAHVGDSRLYRYRNGELTCLTRDHSLLQEQLDEGIISAGQASRAKGSNLLTRALGIDPVVEPEVVEHETRAGDIYLLCSDGLTDMAADEAIAKAIRDRGADLRQCAAGLVGLANDNGGHDNVSVVLARVTGESPARRSWWSRLLTWFR